MRCNTTRAQSAAVNCHFVNTASEVVSPAISRRADGPITVVYREGSDSGRLARYLQAVAIELPICSIVDARQMNPVSSAQIPRRYRKAGAVNDAAHFGAVGVDHRDRTNDIVSAAVVNSEEHFRCVGRRIVWHRRSVQEVAWRLRSVRYDSRDRSLRRSWFNPRLKRY